MKAFGIYTGKCSFEMQPVEKQISHEKETDTHFVTCEFSGHFTPSLDDVASSTRVIARGCAPEFGYSSHPTSMICIK